MRRGFAESKWLMVTMPSSNAFSKTGNDLAARAGRFFKTTECNALARYRRNRALRQSSHHAEPYSARQKQSVRDRNARIAAEIP